MTVSTAPCRLVTCDLPHAVADHLAAAELHLLAVGGEILLDLDDEIGVGEPHAVARGRAEHVGIDRAGHFARACQLSVGAAHSARHVFDREMILGKFGYELGARAPVTATAALIDSLGEKSRNPDSSSSGFCSPATLQIDLEVLATL
jgi:hypothetical protein